MTLNDSTDRQTESSENANSSSGTSQATAEQAELSRLRAHLDILHRAVRTLSIINKPRHFLRAAMEFCNELAALWQCERVSIGIHKGRTIHLKALSHCEHFNRKMELIQDIESAMEECLDQDMEIVYPATPQAMVISRAAAGLSQKHGPSAVLSVPLRLDEQAEAVVALERPAERPFDQATIDAICLTCALCSSRLLNLRKHDRWFGARWLDTWRRYLGLLFGVQHTGAKLVALLVFGFIVFAVFGRGMYRAKSSCMLEAVVQQSICAPFDGFIKEVHVETGDTVAAHDTILAALDTAELRLRLSAAKAEHMGYLKQVDAMMRDGNTAQAQIAEADADKVQAQIDMLSYQIAQAGLVSPIEGTVVTGDLKQRVGAPVKTGDVLFEVTPLDSLRAQVFVAEDQILDIREGQEGRLATVSYPDQRIPFVVERISPMAEVVNTRNVFVVRVRLLETRDWMRPGMEGVAKIDVGRRRYLWIWSRKLVNWIRMKLWI